jgi:integrase
MPAIRKPERDNAWYVDFRYCGRRIRRRSPVQTKAGAEAFERMLRIRFLACEEQGIAPFRQNDSVFSVFAERWMRDYVAVRNRRTTYLGKDMVMRAHLLPAFGNMPLRFINEKRIDQFIVKLRAEGLANKTINNHLSVLRTCLGSAVKWNLLDRVPTMTALPVVTPTYKYLSTEEEQKLVAAARPGYWRTLIVFLLHTGCRFGEAAALRWEDVVLDGPAARVRIQRGVSRGIVGATKNGRPRDIPLTAELVYELRAMPRSGDNVFGLMDGSMPCPSATRPMLHRICERARIQKISWHALRHTFATELSARQVPLRAIQDLLGHSSIAMTCRYAHVADRSLQAAVAALPTLT